MMNISLSFIRILFLSLSILLITAYTVTNLSGGSSYAGLAVGILAGTIFGLVLISFDWVFKRFNLRVFNIAILGLFFGYLLGSGIYLTFQSVFEMSTVALSSEASTLLRMGIFLISTYLGMVLTARASEELHVCIPFVKFKPTSHKKKDILIDSSALLDSRIIDLASSGFLDHHLILPRFMLKELYLMAESNDETIKSKARRCLEVIKKMENIPNLDLRYVDTDFPEIKDQMSKLVRVARLLDANIITADNNRIQQSTIEGIRIINIHALSNALKPITQAGEFLPIKVQRYGKEPRQGVGYLEDGTMVVINGGAEFLGETLRAQVLSVMHTSSGRMIFCNVADEHQPMDHAIMAGMPLPSSELENTTKNYLTL
jgi:uncharacterized protein YacL